VQTISLQSGSSGNCIYVETNGVRLLFDAGICGSEASRRLAAHGRDIKSVNAVIISHDHGDHVRHAGVYQRKFGLPVYITPKTFSAAKEKMPLGPMHDVRLFMSGGTIRFGDVTVETLPTPHDGADGSVFVVVSGDKRLGILTDLGHVFEELVPVVASLDAVFLESNYDPVMLAKGSYPAFLKKRIQGPEGHISNVEAAELLRTGARLKWACLAHLSKNNNHPSIALETHRKILPARLPLYAASRHSCSEVFTV
jgi:phosphoribosyl 1,2-cyclic phosphodiesterase